MSGTDSAGGNRAVEAKIRELAVRKVDALHGYTYEFSTSPNAHLAEYDEMEAELTRSWNAWLVKETFGIGPQEMFPSGRAD